MSCVPAHRASAGLAQAARLPAGVGVRALDGITYFHHDGPTTGVVVLSTWIALCVAGLFLLDRIAASAGIVHAARS